MRYKDYFGINAEELRNKKLFLFDMDGTIYEEEKIFDGTLELLEKIKLKNGYYVFITNNSSKSVDDYIRKVREMGIEADINNFFTSVQATVLYLKDKYSGEKVYCQGTKSFVKELINSGINVTEEVENDAGVVLVGFDTELTSQKLRNTCEMLQKEVVYIATNPDLACPVSFGFIPDCGAICGMIEKVTGKKPIYIGKPEAKMVDIAMEKFEVNKEETVVIGDRLYTDIAAGENAGVTTVCVLTGEATVTDINISEVKPTFTFNSIKDIYNILK